MHMHTEITSHQQVLDLWRSLAGERPRRLYSLIARDLAVPRARVARWHERDSVPAKYWPRLIDLAEQRFGVVITPRQMMLAAAEEAARDKSVEAA